MAAITIGLNNQKGGVAKTTTATALAAIYAQRGLKVLLIDNDPQGNASLQLGVDAGQSLENYDASGATGTVSDIYRRRTAALDLAVNTEWANLDLVAATIDLSVVEGELPTKPGSETYLRKAIETARKHYDLILFDSPPNLGKLNMNVLLASDYYIVPVGGAWALRSVEAMAKAVNDLNEAFSIQPQLLGLVRVSVGRLKADSLISDAAFSNYEELLFNTRIRQAAAVKEAEIASQPVPIYAPRDGVTLDYKRLANEISRRLQNRLPVDSSVDVENYEGGK